MKDATFMGLTFQNFANLNSVGVGLLFLLTIILLLGFFYNKSIKNILTHKVKYEDYLWILILFLGISIIGANMYAYVWGDYPCELCWYQRILIYPMIIIAISELFLKTRLAHKFIGVFAGLTFALASYHYYHHFQKYVLGKTVIMPCDGASGLPNCSEAMVSFGFVTMPLMSMIVAIFVATMAYFMGKAVR